MPVSTPIFKKETIDYIKNRFHPQTRILDVGAGSGIYSQLLRDTFPNMDAIEAFEPYVSTYQLTSKYNNVFVGDILDFSKERLDNYDLFILGDVLEHIDEVAAKKLIATLFQMNKEVIIAVPFNAVQESVNNNDYERHLQPKLTFERFIVSYKQTTPLCVRYDYGVFVNEKTAEFYPIFYDTINQELLEKLKKAYRNRALVDINEVIESLNPIDIFSKSTVNSDDVTIVTGLWDMGRDSLQNGFSRSYEHYKEKFALLLNNKAKMLIYVSKQDEEFVWKYRSKENTSVRVMELDEFRTWFNFFDKVQEIRNKPEWYNQAVWLKDSPQAKLEFYNPVVMSKMFLLNNATLFNPFKTKNFFWIDAGITNTVHPGYFTHDNVFSKLPYLTDKLDKFIFLRYPYEGGLEIHGFGREALTKFSAAKSVNYVCRGGFFGGDKNSINSINSLYYQVLDNTINENHMGTEESLFTILSHRHPELIHTFPIGHDGLVWPFFEMLKDVEGYVKSLPAKRKTYKTVKTNVYVLGFNSPEQFKLLCESFKTSDPEFFSMTNKILLNNSTNKDTFEEYDKLCEEYGFEEIHSDNIGICGGRQFVAEHFDASDADYYMFFEDDMLIKDETFKDKVCKNGMRGYIHNLYQSIVNIMIKEEFDFLKLSFSEFYGDNGMQWAWYNVPQNIRSEIWPDYDKLPDAGFDPNAPRTKFNEIKSLNGVSYINGQIYYSNWPMIVSREGNRKMFLETKWAKPYEQTWMSHMFQETLKGNLNPAVLLASPINHNRISHYKAEERREN